MPTPDLSICVLHYNRWDLTRDCLAAVLQQNIPTSHEILIIDNGSHPRLDGNVDPVWWQEMRHLKHPSIAAHPQIVRHEENRGNIGGQNLCFKHAKGEWVLFVANDVRLHPGCIQQLWAHHQRDIYGWTQLQPLLWGPTKTGIDNAGLRWVWPGFGVGHTHEPQKPIVVDACTSTCYLVERAVWESLGGFDERLVSSHEDIDFGLRLRAEGGLCLCIPRAHAYHLMNQTLKHTILNPRATFHRARLMVVRAHTRGVDRALRLVVLHALHTLITLKTSLGRLVFGSHG